MIVQYPYFSLKSLLLKGLFKTFMIFRNFQYLRFSIFPFFKKVYFFPVKSRDLGIYRDLGYLLCMSLLIKE